MPNFTQPDTRGRIFRNAENDFHAESIHRTQHCRFAIRFYFETIILISNQNAQAGKFEYSLQVDFRFDRKSYVNIISHF